jgi:hypothetical protein
MTSSSLSIYLSIYLSIFHHHIINIIIIIFSPLSTPPHPSSLYLNPLLYHHHHHHDACMHAITPKGNQAKIPGPESWALAVTHYTNSETSVAVLGRVFFSS